MCLVFLLWESVWVEFHASFIYYYFCKSLLIKKFGDQMGMCGGIFLWIRISVTFDITDKIKANELYNP